MKASRSRRLVEQSYQNYRRAIDSGLMQVNLKARDGKRVQLPDGRWVHEFINCSYLGLDLHPEVLEASQRILRDWGVHFCCARSRFSIGPTQELEEGLGQLFRGRAIVFPSVTAAHMATLPLLASGVLTDGPQPMRLVYDRYAHASMQFLRPVLEQEAQVETIEHNDLEALREQLAVARAQGQTLLYIADTVYSMGGSAPLAELLELAHEGDFYLYLDDAHGTSVYGAQGEGYLLAHLEGPLPEHVIMTFSLAKGFGCNGGGVTLPNRRMEELVRCYGMPYAFSTPLDFSLVGAAQASLALHRDGTVAQLQKTLWQRIAHFGGGHDPIHMFSVGPGDVALEKAEQLKRLGYFVAVVFYPIVPKDQAQLRVCLTAPHSLEQLDGLKQALQECDLGSEKWQPLLS